MADGLFTTLYTNIDGKLDMFLNERLNNVIKVVRGPLALGLVIYIALFG
jgi:type IV secretion system protein VirB6